MAKLFYEPGDVLLVTKEMRDKATDKPFDWRYFAIVVEADRHHIKVFRVGADKDIVFTLLTVTCKEVRLLDPSEWPDGVHAFRMRAILEGRVKGLM